MHGLSRWTENIDLLTGKGHALVKRPPRSEVVIGIIMSLGRALSGRNRDQVILAIIPPTYREKQDACARRLGTGRFRVHIHAQEVRGELIGASYQVRALSPAQSGSLKHALKENEYGRIRRRQSPSRHHSMVLQLAEAPR